MEMLKKFLALKAECIRLARAEEAAANRPELTESQKFEHVERAKFYWQMASAEAESALYAEMARPTQFTGKAKGVRGITAERKEFLASVAAGIGTEKREAIAAEAVSTHAKQVRALWKAQGKHAQTKIMNFIKNNGLS